MMIKTIKIPIQSIDIDRLKKGKSVLKKNQVFQIDCRIYIGDLSNSSAIYNIEISNNDIDKIISGILIVKNLDSDDDTTFLIYNADEESKIDTGDNNHVISCSTTMLEY